MKNKLCYLIPLAGILFSCTENKLEDELQLGNNKQESYISCKLNIKQATAYANIFSTYLDENDQPEERKGTRSFTDEEKALKGIDFLIEGKDTLMYAFNYDNNNGFIIISGDNSSFPILAHAKQGNIDFNNIDINSPFYNFIMANKQQIKLNIHNPQAVSSTYFEDWKDLGKEGYEYEIVASNDEPIAVETRGRRKNSTGKASIYPYTGKELDTWSQKGGFNWCAPNKACIGCPAIAIGMLLYDTSNRMLGSMTSTKPSFGYYDRIDISSYTKETETAKKLREIADQIPGYNWGKHQNAASGATPANILTGLRNIGYTKAQMISYNFETLYQNLSFKGTSYFGKETTYNRGVLIGGFSSNGGHIWFCDGYYEQSYTVTKKFIGIKIKSWTEYDDRLYMNWGWGPNKGNGWYAADDNVWTSLEGNPNVPYKVQAVVYTNLSTYEMPR